MIALRVNGREVVREIPPNELLLDFLRDGLSLTALLWWMAVGPASSPPLPPR